MQFVSPFAKHLKWNILENHVFLWLEFFFHGSTGRGNGLTVWFASLGSVFRIFPKNPWDVGRGVKFIPVLRP